MKKLWVILLCLSLLLLCACSLTQKNHVETLQGWSFQYNEGTDDYSLFFGFLDQKRTSIAAEATVDIRIVNENNEEVYRETRSVAKNDFDYYTSQAAGEQYLANIRIPATDILPGTSANGKVFLTVYKADAFSFEEVNCEALYCLPVQDIQLNYGPFPLELKTKDYQGNIESIIQINDITYNFEKEYMTRLSIMLFGEKTYGGSAASYDIISYKLYDGDGYLIDAGEVYLDSLSEGG